MCMRKIILKDGLPRFWIDWAFYTVNFYPSIFHCIVKKPPHRQLSRNSILTELLQLLHNSYIFSKSLKAALNRM